MGYNSKDLLKLLEFNGFTLKRIVGSHQIYFKKDVGIIPISHPKKDMAVGTYNNILKKAGRK